MLNMCHPFPDDNKDSTLQKIIQQELRCLVEMSTQCLTLIKSMIQIDPGQRPKADEIIKSTWLNKGILENVLDFFGG